jgi:hypothetical protein
MADATEKRRLNAFGNAFRKSILSPTLWYANHSVAILIGRLRTLVAVT